MEENKQSEKHNKKTTKEQDKKNIAIIFLLLAIILISAILGITAYARYKNRIEGEGIAQVAKWSFKVNGSSTGSITIDMTETMSDTYGKVTDKRIAPGTSGQFTIEIDASGSEVAVEYSIKMNTSELPTNLNLYRDKDHNDIVTKNEEGIINIEGFIDLANINEKVPYTIYWDWPYRTGQTEEEKKANDVIDTKDSGQTCHIPITVTGVQANPNEEGLSQGTIEIINPKEGTYTAGDVITLNINFTDNIYGSSTKGEITENTAPILKIKIGEGNEKKMTFARLENSSSIKYTYTVTEEDEGKLQIVSYTGNIYDKEGRTVQVVKKELTGKEIIVENKKTLISQITVDNYGDSVDYSVVANGVTLDNWKIFSKDENNVYMIYGDCLPNAAVTAHGISKSNSYNVYSAERDRTTFINALTNTSNWNHLLTDELKAKGATATGTPTVEQYVESWNAKYPSNKLYIAENSIGYYIGTSENPTTYIVQMSSTSGYNDTLYYPHKERWNDIAGYWFATPSAYTDTWTMGPNFDGGVYVSYCSNIDVSIRPIVTLPSNVLGKKDATSGKWEIE